MKAIFDYLFTTTVDESIVIDDTGNVAIDAYNDAGLEWCMCIKTELGKCYVITFGPIMADMPGVLRYGFNYNFQDFIYSEKKLSSIINKFLNDERKMLTQVFTIEHSECLSKLDNIDFKTMNQEVFEYECDKEYQDT